MTGNVILWFRSDLRLHDNPALHAAMQSGDAIIPVYVLDDKTPGIWKRGGASRWWLHHSLKALDQDLQAKGFHPLVYLQGDAFVQISAFAKEAKASGVYWNRCYEPYAMERDKRLKEELKGKAHSYAGYLLYEPFEIVNKTGGQYKVFTPFSKAVLEKGAMPEPVSYKIKSTKPEKVYHGVTLQSYGLMPAIKWYTQMEENWQPGEAGAQARLKKFIESGSVGKYKEQRDFPAIEGVSGLSPHLHFGEISPHRIWTDVSAHKGKNAKFDNNADGFLRQLIWRDFSYHLLYHDHTFPEQPWNKQFSRFPWRKDKDLLDLWKKGKTGYPIIDAGMRQLWQTGWMHNRVRMIVGSFLVKNLLLHWRDGEDWFWDTLVDADLGNNAAGWQWIAGCGADAAPYFRIFNPILQSKKFDTEGAYIRRFVPELKDFPSEYIHAPWEAPPLILNTIKGKYPPPVVDLATSRDLALEAYAQSKSAA